ncbi:MAG: hypothetical protein R3A13_12530 [Bdellovibrionota bacterium]
MKISKGVELIEVETEDLKLILSVSAKNAECLSVIKKEVLARNSEIDRDLGGEIEWTSAIPLDLSFYRD